MPNTLSPIDRKRQKKIPTFPPIGFGGIEPPLMDVEGVKRDIPQEQKRIAETAFFTSVFPLVTGVRAAKTAFIRGVKGESLNPFDIAKDVATKDRSLTEFPGFNRFGAKAKEVQTRLAPPIAKQILQKMPQELYNQLIDLEIDVGAIIGIGGATEAIKRGLTTRTIEPLARDLTFKSVKRLGAQGKITSKDVTPSLLNAIQKEWTKSLSSLKELKPEVFDKIIKQFKVVRQPLGAETRFLGGLPVPKQNLINSILKINPQLKSKDLGKMSLQALTKLAQGLKVDIPTKAPLIEEAKKYKTADEFVASQQIVVANKGVDGKIYYGKPGELHFNLSEKYGEQIRSKMNLKSGEPTWKEVGFAKPGGEILSREEALKQLPIKSSIGKEMDAKDLQEQVKNKLTDIWNKAQAKPSFAKFIPPEKPPVIKPSLGKPPIAPPQKPPTDVVPQGASEAGGREITQAYEKQKDVWIGNKDVRILQSNIEKGQLQKELLSALGKPKYDAVAKDYDRAIQLYIDTKRNLEHLGKFYKDLSPEQKKIADLSKNLPPSVKATADKVGASYTAIGLEAQEADIIRNVLDNYVNRVWDLSEQQKTELFRKFGTTTRHAKGRVLETILEGWAKGYKLKVEGATNNLQILKEEMVKTIEDKRFLKALRKIKTIDGEPLLTTKQLEGYAKVEHPNFKIWKWAGKAEKGKIYGKNTFIDKDGNIFERQELYAPKAQANNLNNILGVSRLKGIGWVDAITKANAVVKAWILQSSFFHHLAFMRSYWLGTNHKRWGEMSIRQAYQQGLRAIEEENPCILLGVKNGLTLGLKQDWNEELLREEGVISKILDKTTATKVVKDKIMGLRQGQADFLFGKFGAGLKAKSFLIEYRNMSKKHPDKTPDEIAKMVANLINDDFGGLHLQRIGRNPTVQHIFRLFALAPDWTESNVRTMVKAVNAGGKEETDFYRRFWAGIFTKGAILTVMGNALMAGIDEDDRQTKGSWQRLLRNYKRAWAEGKMRWLDVDITALYKMLGGKTENRKYFSVFGHFKDPIKFITHPIRSAHYKGSVIYGFFHEALSGIDWAGRRFTTVPEFLGFDFGKGRYKTTRRGKYTKGDPKFGRLRGKTVTWTPGKKGPISYEQFPSFILSQVKGMQPIQIQNLLGWIAGEMEGFDASLKSLGLRVATTYSDSGEEIPSKRESPLDRKRQQGNSRSISPLERKRQRQ